MCLTEEEYKDRIMSHKLSVKAGIQRVIDILFSRGQHHDDDKLIPEVFNEFYPVSDKFNGVKFGSEKYNQALKELQPILKKHYAISPHHPEFYENGINGMTLIDLIEMLIDWKSASSAYGDSFGDSMEIAKKRFGIDEQLFEVLKNTAKSLGYMEDK